MVSLSFAWNEVTNDVAAYIVNVDGVTAETGDVAVMEDPRRKGNIAREATVAVDSFYSGYGAGPLNDGILHQQLREKFAQGGVRLSAGATMTVVEKTRDIGILRTMGLTEGTILRVFFLCGAFTGVIGTAAGVVLGCLLALYIDQIMGFVNWISGGGAWDPSSGWSRGTAPCWFRR